MEFSIDKLAKDVAEKALDEITYEGKTIREWVEIIVKQQPCEDCISRKAVLSYIERILNQGTGKKKSFQFIRKFVESLPSIQPKPKTDALDKIRAELIQSIQNGTLKIESGNEELFRIINKYKYKARIRNDNRTRNSNQ